MDTSAATLTAHDLLVTSLETNADRIRGYLYSDLRGRHRSGRLDAPPTQEVTWDLFGDMARVALERADTFDVTRDPLGWLLGIAQRVVQGHVRDTYRDVKRRRDPDAFSTVPLEQSQPDGTALDLSDLYGGTDTRDAEAARLDAETYLARLPDDQADILRRHHADGEPLADLAREAGCNENAMKARLFRARAAMRALMHEG